MRFARPPREDVTNRFLTLWIAGLIIVVFIIQNTVDTQLSWTVGTLDWRFFSSWVAHGSMSHLLGNLGALLLFGLILEQTVGTKRYATVLLAAALVGNLAGIGSYTRVLGISGAIYGIFGALAVLRPKMVVWVSAMPMPMVLAAAAWAFVDLIGVFSVTGTGHLAHLAGIIAGLGLGFAWRDRFGVGRRRGGGQKRLSRGQKQRLDAALDEWEKRHMR